MINHLFNQDIFKIISLFNLSPGSRFNRKEIKDKINLNNLPLDNALSKLISSNILTKKGNYYSINFENEYAKILLNMVSKQYKLLKEIPFNIYLLLLDLIYYISKFKGLEAYLFGSYSKLIYRENSDIDIAVLGNIDKKLLQKFIIKLEKDYQKNIEVHFFDKKEFYKNKNDPLVKDILRNG